MWKPWAVTAGWSEVQVATWNTGLASETGWGGAVLWDQVLRYWELVTVLKMDLQDTHLVSGESDTYWVEGRKKPMHFIVRSTVTKNS